MNLLLIRLKRLEKIIDSIPGIIRDELVNNRDFIADLNRQQLLRGQKGDGSDMPDYAEGSKQPSAPGKITLFADGLFQGGIEPLFDNEGNFQNISTDRKTPFLIAKFGEEILDLTKESEELLRERTLPNIINKINEQARF